MKEELKIWKQVVKENPALVIGTVNAVALTVLAVVVAKVDINSRVALRASILALKVALKEDLT